MDAFELALRERSRLATAVLESFDDQPVQAVYDAHRGRCYQRMLDFAWFLRLTWDALVRTGGSALASVCTRRIAARIEADGRQPQPEVRSGSRLAQ